MGDESSPARVATGGTTRVTARIVHRDRGQTMRQTWIKLDEKGNQGILFSKRTETDSILPELEFLDKFAH